MNGFLALLAGVAAAVLSGADLLMRLEGVPVGIAALGDHNWVVSCVDPPGVFLVDRWRWSLTEYPCSFTEPRGIAVHMGLPVICDRGSGRLVTGYPTEKLVELELPGGPVSAVPVDWTGDGTPELAVCLIDSGKVVLLLEGRVLTLARLPGARGIASADADGDGDQDIIVACCGSGVHLILNDGGSPGESRIGVLEDGVKDVTVVEGSRPGFPDIVGIACARGGVCRWENPGEAGRDWTRVPVDPFLEGPKGLSGCGGLVLVAALFSPSALYGPGEPVLLPSGCSAGALCGDGSLALGHASGILMEFREAPAP